jgi:hypothetical protein
MNIFGWLEQISYYKKSWNSFSQEEKSSFNPFMVNRFVSMKEDYIDVVNMVSKYQYLPNNKLYEFYCGVIPKNKTFFKYIKAKKKSYNPKAIEKLAVFFKVSTREIKDIYPSLTKQEIENIFQSIGLLDKEIKQLLK